ncbi:MFS transporter [Desemzia incerta]|uniref:MFS transporter n=1 Tax=Desemzia incerta TaxID=82801 RepID=UPI00374E0F4D
MDYQEVRTGKREDGTIYAVYSFSRKIGQAFAGGLGGFALSAVGFVSGASGRRGCLFEHVYATHS